MRFKIRLRPLEHTPWLMWNYQYPLSAGLYDIISKADNDYATFLHDTGYQLNSRKTFKHFTFSDLRLKIGKSDKNGFQIISPTVEWTVSFYIDRIAESFIIGLFQDQKLRLFDARFSVTFVVEQIETLAPIAFGDTIRFNAKSSMVIAEKQDGLDQYLAPTDVRFGHYLVGGLIDKYLSTQLDRGIILDPTISNVPIDFRLIDAEKAKSRKLTIKAGKSSGTEVRGFRDFVFELKAPREVLEVAYYSGIGKFCSNGCGFCEVTQ
ncbi:MAG: CRISPR-associated endoribonuclease Cas6 [Spirosomataceae bacterium]